MADGIRSKRIPERCPLCNEPLSRIERFRIKHTRSKYCESNRKHNAVRRLGWMRVGSGAVATLLRNHGVPCTRIAPTYKHPSKRAEGSWAPPWAVLIARSRSKNGGRLISQAERDRALQLGRYNEHDPFVRQLLMAIEVAGA